MRILIVSLTIVLLSCQVKQKESFDLQGHRGARGVYPENSIPGFIYAINQGSTTIELDLAVSKDNQLVVSHDPYMSGTFCLDPEGNEIPDSVQRSHNIYQMTYEEVRSYDCGSKPHPGFPEQKKMATYKPLFSEMIDSVENYLEKTGLPPVNYNVEIKSSEKTDNTFHPTPDVFSDMVVELLSNKLDLSRVNIQSFDFRVVQYLHENYPDVRLALLIGNDLGLQANLDSLGFTPDIYSCHFSLVSQELVDKCHEMGMKIIPWTINDVEGMQKMEGFGVDGLITDYPNKFTDEVKPGM
ncbi:MAG: glycerophosphodiester phosphodiesterase family protein [Bacteroidota bacterium]